MKWQLLSSKDITLVCKNYCISRKIAWSSLAQSLQIRGSIGSILLWEYKNGKSSSPQSLHPEQNWCKMYLMCEKFQHHTNIHNICVYLQIWSRLRIYIYINMIYEICIYIYTYVLSIKYRYGFVATLLPRGCVCVSVCVWVPAIGWN